MEADKEKLYDVIILGGGPAGLAAAIYAGRARLTTLLIEQSNGGGQIAQTAEIENYPGGMPGESGAELAGRMRRQAQSFGVEEVGDTVLQVELTGPEKVILCRQENYRGRTVIIATGASPMPLGCPGEQHLLGKGVSYCATCDGAFFTGLEVFVVGGGDAAVEEALYLTRFARSVTIIHRRDQLRAAQSIREKAFANPKIHFIWNAVVKELKGDGLLEALILEDTQTGCRTEIKADEKDGLLGLFVFIGLRPAADLFKGQIKMEQGYIQTNEEMATNLAGVFAAGDVRVKSLRQVVTAVADGAVAALAAGKYLDALE